MPALPDRYLGSNFDNFDKIKKIGCGYNMFVLGALRGMFSPATVADGKRKGRHPKKSTCLATFNALANSRVRLALLFNGGNQLVERLLKLIYSFFL